MELRVTLLTVACIGDDVIVHPSVKGEEAERLFPKIKIVKPYLRFTPLPKEETSAAV